MRSRAVQPRGALRYRTPLLWSALLVVGCAMQDAPPPPGRRPAPAALRSGVAALGDGAYEQAITELTQALTSNPRLADAYVYSGRGYHRQDQYAGAIADYTQALTIGTPSGYVYTQRGLAYKSLGDYDRAIADFSQALALWYQTNPTCIVIAA